MHKHKILFLFFLIIVIAQLLSIVFGWPLIHQISKPLIVPLLMFYYVRERNRESQPKSQLLLIALFFSFLGDSLLMYTNKNEAYFMAGLVSFLLSHIGYIFVYRQHKLAEVSNELVGMQRLRFSFPIILAGTGLVVVLYPHLGDMLFPVAVYALVIVMMTLNALFRFGSTNSPSFWIVLAGALLFMLSDSILAINKFMNPFAGAGFIVMLTYITAQYLIVEGLIRHKK
jgi:uncharacterized membrane protein YhhN